MSLHSKSPSHLPDSHLAVQAGVSQLRPHAQVLPEHGHTPAMCPLLPLGSQAAGKGLTPSSCSPDAGSGIHICVIINLGVSGGDWGGVAFSPRLTPPFKQAGRLPSGAAGRGREAAAQVLRDPFRRTHREMN